MNIVLTNTYYQRKVEHTSLISVVPPLDLAYCAALLRKEIPNAVITIIDANVLCYDLDTHISVIHGLQPNMIVVSAATHSVSVAGALFDGLNEFNVVNVLIGTHGSALPAETFDSIPSLDIIVHEEPEYPLLHCVQAILRGESLDTTSGIAFRDETTIHINKKSETVCDIDALPFPARDLLPYDKYSSPYSTHVTSIQTTRGCPGKCSFCDSHLLYGTIYRARSPQKVVDEIAECVEQFKTSYFAIIDHTFTANRSYVTEICHLLIASGLSKKIRWVCNTRVDMMNDATLALMKTAGCLQIGIGIESGKTNQLRVLKKGITTEQIKSAIRAIKRNGIIAMGYSIIGFPHETCRDIEQTKDVIFDLNPHTLQLSFATPLPGTELYDQCKKEGRILSDNWDDYRFLNKSIIRNEYMSNPELLFMRNKILRAFYLRPTKLIELFYFFLFKAKINYLRALHAGMEIIGKLFTSR